MATKWLNNLLRASRNSRKQLEVFRRNRLYAIKQYVGSHYSEEGASDKVPIPLLALAIKIYLRHLVARRPGVMVGTEYSELKPAAFRMEVALNRLLDEIKFGRTMELLALEAMFSMGLVKLGLEPAGQVEVNGYFHDVGQFFVDIVDLDDAVWDVRAKTWEARTYTGNRYRLPLEYVKDSGLFKNTGKLTATLRGEGDEGEDDRAEDVTRAERTDDDEYRPYVELQDFHLMPENVMLTVPFHDDGPILNEQEWVGPEEGPYRRLGYGDVPAQINPLPPIAMWMDLHTLSNLLFRKLGRQAERQKEQPTFRGSGTGDATRLREGKDGEWQHVEDPQGVNVIKSGGVDQVNLAFFIHCRDLYSWMAGNLDAMGGLSPQSETLGQDEMLAASSSKTLEDLQDRTLVFQQNIGEAAAWFNHYDPLVDEFMTKRIEGAGVDVPMLYSPETREGDFLDFNFKIEPASMQYRSPSQKLMMLQQTMTNEIVPMLPFLEAAGLQPDFERYFRLKAKYANMPELSEILKFVTPSMAEQAGPVGGQPRQAAQTQRTNVRVNRSAGTRQGTDKVLMQSLLGSGSQNAEMSAATTPGV